MAAKLIRAASVTAIAGLIQLLLSCGEAEASTTTVTTYVNIGGNYAAGSCTYDNASALWVTGQGKADGTSIAAETTITCQLVTTFLGGSSTNTYSTTTPGKYSFTAGTEQILFATAKELCVTVSGTFVGAGTVTTPQNCISV